MPLSTLSIGEAFVYGGAAILGGYVAIKGLGKLWEGITGGITGNTRSRIHTAMAH